MAPWTPQTSTGAARTRDGRRRVCFQLQFEPSKLPDYLKDHEAVWPEMQKALVETGWHNYSLFYRPDGFAVGYFETDQDFQSACARMDAYSVNKKWQAAMAQYTPAGQSPLVGAADMTHYFYLGTDVEGAPATGPSALQLAAAAATIFGAGLACGLALARTR